MRDNKKFRLSDQQISTSLSDEVVILNHNKGLYFSLNEVGTLVWKQLENNQIKSFEELKNSILAEFEVDEEACKNDLNDILSDLLNEKLVEEMD